MECQLRQKQQDELIAFIECIGEEFVSVKEDEQNLRGVISVALNPSSKIVLISATDGEDYRQFMTAQLPPVDLLFELPADYPLERAAIIDVESIWMPSSLRKELLECLHDVLQANIGFPSLCLCHEVVKEFVADVDLEEIRLELSDYARKQILLPIELLKLVRDESEKAEMTAFLAQSHDCEICLENKAARDCVRFLPCGHSFCKECVTGYFKEKLTNQQMSRLTCLADDCQSSASQNVIMELLGQNELERYERILLDRAVENMDDMATCPKIECQKPSVRSETTEHLATCLFCGYDFCTECKRSYHGDQECPKVFEVSVSALVENEGGTWGLKKVTLDEYLRATPEEREEMGRWYGGIKKLEIGIRRTPSPGIEMSKKARASLKAEMEEAINKADAHSYVWIKRHSKKCPHCGIPIQKKDGCNRMPCSMCKINFCWTCTKILDEQNLYGHFNGGNCHVYQG